MAAWLKTLRCSHAGRAATRSRRGRRLACARWLSPRPETTGEHGIHNRIPPIPVPEEFAILQRTAAFSALVGRSWIDAIDAFHVRILGQIGKFDRSRVTDQHTILLKMKQNRREQMHNDDSSQLTARLK